MNMTKLEAAQKLAAKQNEYKEDLKTLCEFLSDQANMPEEITKIVNKYNSVQNDL